MSYIITNGRIMTFANIVEHVEAVAIHKERIVRTGSLDDCRSALPGKYELIDLNGRLLLPAFTDTHTHFVEYAKKRLIADLSSCNSIDDIVGKLSAFRQSLEIVPRWLLGSGWDKNRFSDLNGLDNKTLDHLFPDIPVVLQSRDFHAKWCNSKALQVAGISSASDDPFGGRISRYPGSSEPDGLLYETALDLIEPHVVPPDRTQLLKAIRETVADAWRWGFSTIHTMEGVESWALIRDVVSSGCNIRFCWHFPLDDLDRQIALGTVSYHGDEYLKTGGVKIFADGALGSQTAWMFEPYPNDPQNHGINRYADEELQIIVDKAAEHDIAATIHAIGNRGVHQVASVFITNRRRFPHKHLLQRIEHLQSCRPKDYPLLSKAGAYLALQPVHLANDVPMIETYWKAIQDQAYPFGDVINMGLPFGFGSDVPIETMNPFHAIYTALERKPLLDPQAASWFPAQKINVRQALYGYTLGAAMGSRGEHLRGSITPGKLADLIILPDLIDRPHEEWLDCSALLTMINGDVVQGE